MLSLLKRFFGCLLEWLAKKRSWYEKDGIIYFSVTSDGTNGEEWIARLKKNGLGVTDYAKSLLRSEDFKPTKGVKYEIAVLKGTLSTDSDRTTKKIRAEADKRKLITPSAEIACLVREMFTDENLKAMGITWLVIMHNPIEDFLGDWRLLTANRFGRGRWLDACVGLPNVQWRQNDGFAFVAQVSPQS